MSRKNLWAPWRMQYLESLAEDDTREADALIVGKELAEAEATTCFLADYWARPEADEEHFVIYRDRAGMILLNRYPYSNGHLMVALGAGRPRLLDYDVEERITLWELVSRATDLMERALNPQGINIGINQGRAAGAGVPQHLHVHLVPRWSGDTNFITVVGEVRVVPDALERMYRRYRTTLSRMSP